MAVPRQSDAACRLAEAAPDGGMVGWSFGPFLWEVEVAVSEGQAAW